MTKKALILIISITAATSCLLTFAALQYKDVAKPMSQQEYRRSLAAAGLFRSADYEQKQQAFISAAAEMRTFCEASPLLSGLIIEGFTVLNADKKEMATRDLKEAAVTCFENRNRRFTRNLPLFPDRYNEGHRFIAECDKKGDVLEVYMGEVRCVNAETRPEGWPR